MSPLPEVGSDANDVGVPLGRCLLASRRAQAQWTLRPVSRRRFRSSGGTVCPERPASTVSGLSAGGVSSVGQSRPELVSVSECPHRRRLMRGRGCTAGVRHFRHRPLTARLACVSESRVRAAAVLGGGCPRWRVLRAPHGVAVSSEPASGDEATSAALVPRSGLRHSDLSVALSLLRRALATPDGTKNNRDYERRNEAPVPQGWWTGAEQLRADQDHSNADQDEPPTAAHDAIVA